MKEKEWKRIGNFFELIAGKRRKTLTDNIKNLKKKTPVEQTNLVHKDSSKEIPPPDKKIKPEIPRFLLTPSLRFENTDKAETVDIVIGLDLGTAWTKVVIQDIGRRRALAVPFKAYGNPENIYLLPTRVALTDDHLDLCKKDHPHICNDLKIILMEESDQTFTVCSQENITITGVEVAAIFVALVLRYVRHWFMNTQSDIYKKNQLRWQFNMGIPIKNYDTITIKDAFHKVAIAGWWMSTQNGQITIDIAKKAIQMANEKAFHPGIHREDINVVPEVAAEVAGYAYSHLREEGLHMLVDIGATTMDVSTFVLNKKEGGDLYGFLSAEVDRYGAFELHRWRLEAIKNHMNSWFFNVGKISETLEPVPESYNDYIPQKDKIPNFDEIYIHEASVLISKVVARTKKERDPNSERWKDGLPIFLCGGGSEARFYSDKLLKNAEDSLKGIEWSGFRPKSIPKPENLEVEGLRAHDFHRLAVAYGLSFQFENIGVIIPPSEIDNIPPSQPSKKFEDKFISKEMV